MQKNVTGTNAYWNQVKQELKTTITQVGPPAIFWTLSCAEFHGPDFHSLFSSSDCSSDELRQNVLNNPNVLDWFFTQRTESFVKNWLQNSLGATWHWYRYEYAVQRGSIHCHGVAKLKDDPGLCQLTKIALKGFLASKTKENSTTSLTDEQLALIDADINAGHEAEEKACQYVDNLMSTWNPCHPDEFPWVKPKTHPSKVRYENILPPSYDDNYIDLLNMVQRNTNCNSAYCLKQNKDGTQSCRFSYPHQTCDQTHLEFEKVKTEDRSQQYRAKVVTTRNDPRLSRHQRLQLQG